MWVFLWQNRYREAVWLLSLYKISKYKPVHNNHSSRQFSSFLLLSFYLTLFFLIHFLGPLTGYCIMWTKIFDLSLSVQSLYFSVSHTHTKGGILQFFSTLYGHVQAIWSSWCDFPVQLPFKVVEAKKIYHGKQDDSSRLYLRVQLINSLAGGVHL